MKDIVNTEILNLISQSDLVIKVVILILLSCSVWSWAIIVDKIFKFRLLKAKTAKFKKLFWSGKMLEDIYKQIKNKVDSPATILFAATMQEWESSDVVKIAKSKDAGLKNSLKERLLGLMEVALNRSMTKLKYGLNFLFITGSTGTLIGLFGTVWGIMTGFKTMVATRSTSLITIAPDVASALTSSIIGIAVAVPAIIFYYIYSNKVEEFEEEMENFVCEIITILSRELDQ